MSSIMVDDDFKENIKCYKLGEYNRYYNVYSFCILNRIIKGKITCEYCMYNYSYLINTTCSLKYYNSRGII